MAKTVKAMAVLWDPFTKICEYITEIGIKFVSFDSSDMVRYDRLPCHINSMCKIVTLLKERMKGVLYKI